MIAPASPVRRVKNRSSNRSTGTATTSVSEKAAPIRSSASCVPAIGAPSRSNTRTGTPLRSVTRSATACRRVVGVGREHAVLRFDDVVDGPQDVGGLGDPAQDDDLEAGARVVVHRLDAQRLRVVAEQFGRPRPLPSVVGSRARTRYRPGAGAAAPKVPYQRWPRKIGLVSATMPSGRRTSTRTYRELRGVVVQVTVPDPVAGSAPVTRTPWSVTNRTVAPAAPVTVSVTVTGASSAAVSRRPMPACRSRLAAVNVRFTAADSAIHT